MSMTPYEIQNKKFDKGMSGYNRDEVHAFLLQVSDYLEELEEEKTELLRKMEVLAEKLEEYREDEESLRAALIGAQKLGDSVIRDAKKKADAILVEAKKKSDDLLGDIRLNMDKESMALSQMQSEVARFKATLLSMYKQHIEVIQAIPYDEQDSADVLTQAVRQQPTVMEMAPEPIPEPEPLEEPEAPKGGLHYEEVLPEESRRKFSRFGGDLKDFFGEDHPIERKD